MAKITTKTCRSCKKDLPHSDFARSKPSPDGLLAVCKECDRARRREYYAADPEKYLARSKKYYQDHLEEKRAYCREYNKGRKVSKSDRRKYSLKYNHGIEPEEYESLLTLQNGVCAICGGLGSSGESDKALAVDHDHDTEQIRGLLCRACNTALGLLQDDPNLLYKAADYLKRGGVKGASNDGQNTAV